LFTSIDDGVWERSTYGAFKALLDNYVAETGSEERVSDSERSETYDFLNAIMDTEPMKFCHEYCRAKDPDNVPEDPDDFQRLLHKVRVYFFVDISVCVKNKHFIFISIARLSDVCFVRFFVLRQIWFELYGRSRGGRADSSGFEHVFVGEIKDDQVSGLHNWLQMALEEQAGRLDYRGYIKPRSQSSDESGSNDHLLTVQFRWKGVEKFVGSSFIGTSPEFEVALYTMCFLVGDEENHVELNTGTDTFGLAVKCYRIAGNKIGTSFPEVTSHYDD
jgi:poly(U)-specific endoribonuclease